MRFLAAGTRGGFFAAVRYPLAVGVGIVIAVSAISVSPAEAKKRKVTKKRAAAVQTYSPPYAAIVVDANSGKVLHGVNEDALRHPASITKVMTLYLLFEQMERGRLTLESEMAVSARAASQAPSKLGLRAGSTLEVEDAIKALVTKSANDASVVVAEHIGGSVENFARLMTAKARALGMSRTVFVNPNGLPAREQVTTARDLALLGRAVHDRFPRYYKYFATPSFTYAGRAMRNHNNLLSRVEGMEGIKTGYIRASGFNLLSAVKRDDHYIVSVVLGGKTARGRDAIMAGLIEKYIDAGSSTRTAALVTEGGQRTVIASAAPSPAAAAAASPAASPAAPPVASEVPAPRPRQEIAAAAPVQPPLQLAPTTPMAAAAVAAASVQSSRPRPAVVTAAAPAESDREATASLPARADGSTTARTILAPNAPVAANAATTPSGMRWVVGPKSTIRAVPPTPPAAIPAVPASTVALVAPKAVETKAARAREAAETRPSSTRTGWMIQIGATPDVDQANELLSRARSKASALSGAKPFTEKVQSGGNTLYRARFAGLDNAADAQAACNALKRSGFGCFATRN